MHQNLQKAVSKVLSPLVRLLLRHGVSHAEFANWARQVYVREAFQHFGMHDKTPTTSRVAIVTGINRKEVKRIRELPDDVDTGVSKHNRAVRVVTGWLQDQSFQDEAGQARALRYGNPEDGFNQLVKRHGGDVPARAVLDELTRVGTVEHRDGVVRLLQQGYVPHQSESAMLDIFATSACDLLTTLDHNLNGGQPRRLQMSVAYDQVSTQGREVFRQLSAEQGMQLLRTLDESLSPHDQTGPNAQPGNGSHRVGLGLYWIEELDDDATADLASSREED